MENRLHYQTVTPLLMDVLNTLMRNELFVSFRLVGGTSLSLQLGHRLSVDIDLFSDAFYGTIDFVGIDSFLKSTFSYVDTSSLSIIGFGKSYFIGNSKTDCVKLDLYYTDTYFDEPLVVNGIRLASLKEVTAMKLDVISRGGRKKDYWDVHELAETFSLEEMLFFHKERHPYTHDPELIKANFISFSDADKDFEPVCLKGKYWELIKLDLIDFVRNSNPTLS